MEKLLDKEVHQQWKAPSLLTYMSGHKQSSIPHNSSASSASAGSSSNRSQSYYGAAARERSSNAPGGPDSSCPLVSIAGATAANGGARPKINFSLRYNR